ncbi:MAG: glycerate kinase [Tissierellia bacterium]|nr:glycerate kinase [Tissierellia bacterium]
MKSNILVAMDSFKGSLSSIEAARAVEKGLRSKLPQAEIRLLPLADGGEGTLEMLSHFFDLELHREPIEDLYGKPLLSKIYFSEKIAFFEAAQAAGLQEKKEVFKATSLGFGKELLLASSLSPEKILLGLGGTGVNDGGMGLLHSLGLRFYQDELELRPCLDSLFLVNRVAGEITSLPPIVVACDVNNPLLGSNGASTVYGPQKGLGIEDIARVDRAMEGYALLLENHFDKEVKDIPGAGAAGGLGFALLLIGAELKPGFSLLTELCGFEEHLAWADIIITGEGRFDKQSLQGKGPTELARRGKKKNKAVFGFFGQLIAQSDLFDGLFCIQRGPVSLKEAMDSENTKINLEMTATALAGTLKAGAKLL